MENGLGLSHNLFLGFCGYSGSGKTTLMEKLAALLTDKGLSVGYFKHDAHKFDIDRKGKDSDRLFHAGVKTLAITSPDESAARFKSADLDGMGESLFAECDIVLVEGYKNAQWDKLWVHPYDGSSDELPELDNLVGQLGGGSKLKHDDITSIASFVNGWLEKKTVQKPLYGGLLIGGKSVRMGSPKSLLEIDSETFAEKQYRILQNKCDEVYLLGTGRLPESLRDAPRLADPHGIEGPIAGLITAGRFAPSADWLVLAVDMPNVKESHIEKLLTGRKPGFRCVMAQNPDSGKTDPLCALYSSQLLHITDARRQGELSITKLLARLGEKGAEGLLDATALKNVNRPEELD
ncbi:MAG: molybdopterin-guanine dinucleotide biosynthesis protein B [Nitrospinota bacterium]